MMSKIISAVCLFLVLSISAHSQFVVKNITGSPTNLSDIFMVDASVGYAGGLDGIFKTTNGGQTWSLLPYFTSTLPIGQQEYYTALNEITLYFLNADIGYAVGWNATGNYEEIMKTTDGGTTWQIQHYFNPDPAPFQPLDRRLTDIAVSNSNTAIAVGYMGRILKTENGGSSWIVKTSGTSTDLEAVSFLNGTVGVAAGEGLILSTTDGGETWTSNPTPYKITDIAYLTANLIIATTSSGNIIQSSDGGATWVPDLFQHSAPLVRLSFINSQVGFVIGDGILLKTIDGGAHFEKYIMEYNRYYSVNLTGIDAHAENRIYMTTSRGELYTVFDQTIPFSPISRFTSSKNSTCDNSGEAIVFSNQGRADYQYQWLIDNIVKATTKDYSHEFTIEGNHEVSLVAYNGIKYDTSSAFIYVITTSLITKEMMLYETEPDTLEISTQGPYNSFRIYNLQEGVEYQAFRNGIAISSKIKAQNTDIIRYIEVTFPNVSSGGVYDFTVKAELTSTCGVVTQEKSFTRVLLDVPMRPTDLKGFHLVNNGTRLEWHDRSAQETHYQVERKAEGESQYQIIATVSGFGSEIYYDYGPLVTHQRYYYRVAGVNSFGISQYSNVVSMFMHGDIIYVNPQASGANNGSTWQNGLTDLYQALRESTTDDEIWLIKGTYVPDPEKLWQTETTRGVFGGFNGTETMRDQRDWKVNKTIFSGDIGLVGDATDNITNIISIGGEVSGVTITGAKGYGIYAQLVTDCVIEFNNVGVLARNIHRCIIRNNTVGIQAIWPYVYDDQTAITNSFIYNNDRGFEAAEATVQIANCTFYANSLGSIKAHYYNEPHDVALYVYSSVFGYRENDKVFDMHNGKATFLETIIADPDPSVPINGINYHMNYMSGDDGILGNDDDLLYFPEPYFQNAGRVHWSLYIPYFGNLTKDFFNNPRLRGDTLDIGPAEFLPDTIKVPELTVTQRPVGVSLSWPHVQSGVTRIWLERKMNYNGEEFIFIPVPASATSYEDTSAESFKNYTYQIRLQKGNVISFPGTKHSISPYPQAIIQASQLNNFYNQVKYSYAGTYPVKSALLQISTGDASSFQNVMPLTLSPEVTTYEDMAPNLTRYYRIVTTFDLDGGTTETYSDTVKVITLPNQAPSITEQKQSSISEGQTFIFTNDLITFQDDYNFPLGFEIEILPGEHYTANDRTIIPEAGFTGDLIVNVRVGDRNLMSAVYPFVIHVAPQVVIPPIEGDFSADRTEISAGDVIHFTSTYTGGPTSWQWQFEGGIPSSSDAPNPSNIAYPTAGLFKVQLTMENKFQQITLLKEGYIKVNNLITEIEEDSDSEIFLYPNPAFDEFYVHSEKNVLNFRSIHVTNLAGEQIEGKKTPLDSSTIKITLPPGGYVISISIQGKVLHKKVFVF